MDIDFNSDKVVVFSTPGYWGKDNAYFDRTKVGVSMRHIWWFCNVYEEAKKRGIQILTPDLFLSLKRKPKVSILWEHSIQPDLSMIHNLSKMGVHPAVLIGFENPLYAPLFYLNLKKYSRLFDHTFMAAGARSLVSPRTKFHDFLAPHAYNTEDVHLSQDNGPRKFLTMISSNIRLHPVKLVVSRVVNMVKPLPSLSTRDLYLERLLAIEYFSKRDDFDLHGIGWDHAVPYTFGEKARAFSLAVKKSWRGAVDDKLKVFQNYKFSICFENCMYEGLVTEKIFDSLVSGCIPIYFGAPDISRYVPKDSFINFSEFGNFADVERYITTMDEKTYKGYREAIRAYLASEQFQLLGQKKVCGELVDLFESYF